MTMQAQAPTDAIERDPWEAYEGGDKMAEALFDARRTAEATAKALDRTIDNLIDKLQFVRQSIARFDLSVDKPYNPVNSLGEIQGYGADIDTKCMELATRVEFLTTLRRIYGQRR